MDTDGKTSLSQQDKEVMDLLEEAKQLYKQYRDINDLPLLVQELDESSYPVPAWDSPLTLVVKTPK